METELGHSGVIVDWTITLGNMIQLFGFLMAGIVFGLILRGDVKILTVRLTAVESFVKAVSDILPSIARQEERLDSHMERIRELERRRD